MDFIWNKWAAAKYVWKKGALMYCWSETGEWSMAKRYNYELYEIFNEPNSVNYEYIKVNRLAWAGHLVCMSSDRTLKKIFNTKRDGTRSVGRPKLWWEDGVDQDVRILAVKNWKKLSLNRDEWAQLLKQTRAHQGLSSQWWWWWVSCNKLFQNRNQNQ